MSKVQGHAFAPSERHSLASTRSLSPFVILGLFGLAEFQISVQDPSHHVLVGIGLSSRTHPTIVLGSRAVVRPVGELEKERNTRRRSR